MKFSFVIPAYNEEEYLAEVLKSIHDGAIDALLSYEIIVVDNGSSDNTSIVAKANGACVHKISKSTVAYARNYGANFTSGEVLCFVDGDTVLTKKWFSTLKKRLIETDFIASEFVMGSHVVIPEKASWIEKYWFSGGKSTNYIGSANLICSASAFSKVEGFDESKITGEDYDFCCRIKYENINFTVDDNFEAIHLGYPKSIYAFGRRELWHGMGDVQNIKSFLRSKVSLVSQIYLILVFLFFILLSSNLYVYAVLAFLFISLLNTVLTLKLRNVFSIKSFFLNSFLNIYYFMCRAISPFYYILKSK